MVYPFVDEQIDNNYQPCLQLNSLIFINEITLEMPAKS